MMWLAQGYTENFYPIHMFNIITMRAWNSKYAERSGSSFRMGMISGSNNQNSDFSALLDPNHSSENAGS